MFLFFLLAYSWHHFHIPSVFFRGINPGGLLVLVFDRIIDNRTLKLITESSDSSPKTDKDADSNLRGNYFLLLIIMQHIYIKLVSLWCLYLQQQPSLVPLSGVGYMDQITLQVTCILQCNNNIVLANHVFCGKI